MTNSIYIDYENVLIGRHKEIAAYHFYGQEPIDFNQKLAVKLFRYAIENVLGWEKEEAIQKFDGYMIQKMKLGKLLKYIRWPTEIEVGNAAYILHLLYPEDVVFNNRKLVEDLYLRVLNGEMSFPREYFAGNDGFRKYCICFSFLIANYKTFHSVDDIYQFFLSERGNQFLDMHRLKTPKIILSIDICDVIYYVTKQEPGSGFYYGFYKFQREWEAAKALKKNSQP